VAGKQGGKDSRDRDIGRAVDFRSAATTFLNDFFAEFVTLLVILDPIATVPMYLAVTQGLGRRQSLAMAFYAVGIAFLILLFFILAGQFLLTMLKIPMASFQLAGSVVMLLISLKMVLGTLLEETAAMPAQSTALQRAIFPLATSEIAGGIFTGSWSGWPA